jgi:hypothetical protein
MLCGSGQEIKSAMDEIKKVAREEAASGPGWKTTGCDHEDLHDSKSGAAPSA